MRGTETPSSKNTNPKAARIAALSAEYLDAEPKRRAEIGEEIEALISGRLVMLPVRQQ